MTLRGVSQRPRVTSGPWGHEDASPNVRCAYAGMEGPPERAPSRVEAEVAALSKEGARDGSDDGSSRAVSAGWATNGQQIGPPPKAPGAIHIDDPRPPLAEGRTCRPAERRARMAYLLAVPVTVYDERAVGCSPTARLSGAGCDSREAAPTRYAVCGCTFGAAAADLVTVLRTDVRHAKSSYRKARNTAPAAMARPRAA